MPESLTPPPRYGAHTRGISGRDVELAADACLRAGSRPTIEKIRERIGRGSPNTINPLLDAWWQRLASRLDGGPAALHRLPESVAHVAEALWMQALEEGRRRAEQELNRQSRDTARTREDLDVRSHVLSLREGELESRLKDRERAQAALEAQVRELTQLLRKEQVTRDAQGRRIATLEEQLLTASASARAARPFPALARQRGVAPAARLAHRKNPAASARGNPVRKRRARTPPARVTPPRRGAKPKANHTTRIKRSTTRSRRR
jgi:hypothetical protein